MGLSPIRQMKEPLKGWYGSPEARSSLLHPTHAASGAFLVRAGILPRVNQLSGR
jgi:hypothetical protein